MLKLILKVPKKTDASLLLTAAIALAEYKRNHYYKFRGADYDGSITDYGGVDLLSFEPDYVADSPNLLENCKAGISEYEIHGDVLDVFLTEQLNALKKIFPFEMYFENRGKYDAEEWMYKHPDRTGDIDDAALHRLFWQERLA